MLLFLADVFELFQTKVGFLKALIYCGILILPIPLVLMEFKANRNLTESIFRKGIPMLLIVGLIYLNPLKILFNIATWKTQIVKLVNENNLNHKVEFQMKDIGAFGYSKRTAEVYYLTDFFYIILKKEYNERNYPKANWKRVNQHKNEIELK